MLFAYITCSNRTEAQSIGRALVEKRLAACVNFWEGMSSLYWWEGKVEEGQETVLIAKTTSEKSEALVKVVKALHSYSCPCVVLLPIEGGNPDYLKWISESCP